MLVLVLVHANMPKVASSIGTLARARNEPARQHSTRRGRDARAELVRHVDHARPPHPLVRVHPLDEPFLRRFSFFVIHRIHSDFCDVFIFFSFPIFFFMFAIGLSVCRLRPLCKSRWRCRPTDRPSDRPTGRVRVRSRDAQRWG